MHVDTAMLCIGLLQSALCAGDGASLSSLDTDLPTPNGLRSLLTAGGSFPEKHRMLIWQSLLCTPGDAEGFQVHDVLTACHSSSWM